MLRFAAKVPELGLDVRSVNMDFTYGSSFTRDAPEAYETLLLDAMLGDASLFTRADEVEAAWGIVTPIHRVWDEWDKEADRRAISASTRPGRGGRTRPTSSSSTTAGAGGDEPMTDFTASPRSALSRPASIDERATTAGTCCDAQPRAGTCTDAARMRRDLVQRGNWRTGSSTYDKLESAMRATHGSPATWTAHARSASGCARAC